MASHRPEKLTIPPAKILESHTHTLPGKLRVTEYFIETLWDYAEPKGPKIRLFARAISRHLVPGPGLNPSQISPPWLLYLQGGPGFECRSPQSYPWTQTMVEKGYQMLYLDMRGTGLSTPISASTLDTKDEKACIEKLKKLRSDNIVRDCEAVRIALNTVTKHPENEPWSVMGQSFGGFCCVTYLSMYQESLREVFLTGGLPPVTPTGPDEVYKNLSTKVKERNQAYYRKFPDDIYRVKDIIQYIQDNKNLSLPSGGTLTARRFLMMGFLLGFHGGIDALHELILRAHNEITFFQALARSTADAIEHSMPFDNNPLHALIHESIYCQNTASEWSASRIISSDPAFDIDAALSNEQQPVFLTGEMVLPNALDDFAALRPFKNIANELAKINDWPYLYDITQLRQNKVPVYAAVYIDDMYVDHDFSIETAKIIKGCKWFATTRLYHDGLRAKEEEVIRGLWELRDDTID